MNSRFVFIILLGLHQTRGLSNPFDCKVPGLPAKLYHVQDDQIVEITDASSLLPGPTTTYIMVHGWFDDSIGVQEDISKALAPGGNSILIDYGSLAKEFYINCADVIVRTLGDFLSDFIVNATMAGHLQPENIYLIGHSLGAHVVGYVGRTVHNRTSQQIQRISGLDPAGPVFRLPFTEARKLKLNKDDASFVDILHTSSIVGDYETMGTVDVYAHGYLGSTFMQKACIFSFSLVCSHGLSKNIYFESINSCGIVAKQIDGEDEVVYGFHMPVTTQGKFKFSPNKKPPYGSGNQTCS